MTPTGAEAGRPRVMRTVHRQVSPSYSSIAVVPVFILALAAAGCGAASPRYTSVDRPPQPRDHDEEEGRFAARIREEETREDDRKVDLAKVREGLAVSADTVAPHVLAPPGVDRDRVLLDVVGYLGTPYRHGGMSRDGIDCSGFTLQVFSNALNLKLPRSTREQYDAGAEVEREQLQFGDLVFFNTTGHSPSHVGIYIEDDLFAHASVSYGVTISSLESTYYGKRYVGAKRVVNDPERK